MRTLLLDWIQGVCSEVGFRRETFYLAVSFVDLYFARKPQSRQFLQLLGLTSLFIAMKIEEIQHSSVNSFVHYAGGAFSCGQILAQERDILITLRWKTYPDTCNTWLDSYLSHWDLFVVRLRARALNNEDSHSGNDMYVGFELPIFKQE